MKSKEGKKKVRTLMSEEQKRKKGLIKAPKENLERYFNYHYLFIHADNFKLQKNNISPKKISNSI